MNNDGNGWALLFEQCYYEGNKWQREWVKDGDYSYKLFSLSNHIFRNAPVRFFEKLKNIKIK